MSYWRTCPICGAHLDPGEPCDCQDIKKSAPGATNTGDGKGCEENKIMPTAIVAGEKGACQE